MAGAYVDDSLICDAYIWALDKYRNQYGTRGFRPLADADFGIIYELRVQLGREWAIEKDMRGKAKYYLWRHERLNELLVEKMWSKETRDLYASILSTLLTWSRNGQNKETKERLKLLYVGASLCLQFLNRFPTKLTTNGVHDAKPL